MNRWTRVRRGSVLYDFFAERMCCDGSKMWMNRSIGSMMRNRYGGRVFCVPAVNLAISFRAKLYVSVFVGGLAAEKRCGLLRCVRVSILIGRGGAAAWTASH